MQAHSSPTGHSVYAPMPDETAVYRSMTAYEHGRAVNPLRPWLQPEAGLFR
jgi:hypothetical protein